MIRIRAVDVIPRVFDPPPGAKFSMCTASSLGRQIRKKGSRGGPDGLANIVDHPLDHYRIVALGHDSDQRFGSRLADHQAAFAFKFGLGRGNPLADAVRLERLAAAVEADVLQYLRYRLELAKQFARRSVRFDQCSKHLQSRNEAVARSRMIGEDDVPRLLAANIAAGLTHLFQHIAVANL